MAQTIPNPQPHTWRGVTPAGGGAFDWNAFERAIQTSDKHRSDNRVIALIAQWEVIITIFKHSFEIPKLLSIPGAPDDNQHRTALTGLLAMGETIWLNIKDLDDATLATTGYKKTFVQSNLEYLREKYLDWNAPLDLQQIAADWKLMTDERAAVN